MVAAIVEKGTMIKHKVEHKEQEHKLTNNFGDKPKCEMKYNVNNNQEHDDEQ